MSYDHQKIEKKWQEKWLKEGIYSPQMSLSKNKFYNLWMFPYPSAEGLHAGHAFASTGSDIYGRYQRMRGRRVFQPIGYDSFGIHSENYAIKTNEQPAEMLKRTTINYDRQMKSLGHGYDWTRTVTTSSVDYYKWTQWLFIKLFEAGLAYRKKADVNWCPSCKTVLSDEQVISGECERCTTKVTQKSLEQWFFKITKYADRLLENLDKIDWSERVVTAQRNWIGKSEGMLIKFEAEGSKTPLEVFTTRPDTLNAVTFIATSKLYEEGSKEKRGKFSGRCAIDPVSGRKLPIWDTNYIAPDYGTGVVMGVPAHDERDLEFAKKYGIDIVDKKPDEKLWETVEKNGWGRRHTNYHLRDWLVSRQRYWGAPIPMVECPKCGWQAVKEEDLPISLPEIGDYAPEGKGKGPLANHPEFYETRCSKCGGKAKRETDVMDTFVDSSWYFLKYPSVGAKSASKVVFDPEITRHWLPIDLYFGGAEHSVLHLMYARFVTMVLKDLGYLDFEEPFPRFFAHGLMIKDGAKMSKSRGNVVNPDEYIEKYGADALRLYLMFMGPMDGYPDFRDKGIEGMVRFVKRVWEILNTQPTAKKPRALGAQARGLLMVKMHQTIKKVTKDIEEFKYNTAIAAIMEYVNELKAQKAQPPGLDRGHLVTLVKLLAPFAPHMAEEAWVNILGEKFSIHTSSWPKYDEELAREEALVMPVQVDGKLRAQVAVGQDLEKRARQAVDMWIKGKKVKNTVLVSGKIVNFVTK